MLSGVAALPITVDRGIGRMLCVAPTQQAIEGVAVLMRLVHRKDASVEHAAEKTDRQCFRIDAKHLRNFIGDLGH